MKGLLIKSEKGFRLSDGKVLISEQSGIEVEETFAKHIGMKLEKDDDPKIFSVDEVAQICADLFRATTTGTLSSWEPSHYKAFITDRLRKEWVVNYFKVGDLYYVGAIV